jgi:rod shape-determining protein MreC
MAEVIARDVFQDFVLINKGKDANFASGMPVLAEGKVLLGRISEVYDNFSKVMLISNKSSSFDAKISEKDIYGVIKGEGNSSIIFDLIPQDKKAEEGDLIITSSLGGIFPKGLLVGQVKEIKKSDIKPYQKAILEPMFNLNDLELVFIITNFR